MVGLNAIAANQFSAVKLGDVEPSAEVHEAAKKFEQEFVKQMLQYSGLDDAFGSEEGLATDALSSFVLDHIAEKLVDQGGFGLADQFAKSLARLEELETTEQGIRV